MAHTFWPPPDVSFLDRWLLQDPSSTTVLYMYRMIYNCSLSPTNSVQSSPRQIYYHLLSLNKSRNNLSICHSVFRYNASSTQHISFPCSLFLQWPDERTGVQHCHQDCVELCQANADGPDPLRSWLTGCQADHTKCKQHLPLGGCIYPKHGVVAWFNALCFYIQFLLDKVHFTFS